MFKQLKITNTEMTSKNHDYYTIVSKPQTRTISFIGDKYENIQAIIDQLDFQCQCQCLRQYNYSNSGQSSILGQFKQILIYFYQKIYKLREERQFYKQKYTVFLKQTQQKNQNCMKEIERLNEENLYFKNQCLKLNNQKTRQILQEEEDDSNLLSRNNSSQFQELQSQVQVDHKKVDFDQNVKICNNLSRQTNKIIYNENQNCIKNISQNNKQMSKIQGLRQRKSSIESNLKNINLEALLRKYNIKMSQLQIILEEYLQNEKDTHEMFQKQEERRLFLLAKKMEKDMWNKKIKKDIERIMEVKSLKLVH